MATDDLPLFQWHPRSHKGESVTSRIAAETLARSGKWATQKGAVLAALRENNGSTSAELGQAMGVHWLVPARRLTELERDGLITKGQERTCKVKGSLCRTWWLKQVSAVVGEDLDIPDPLRMGGAV